MLLKRWKKHYSHQSLSRLALIDLLFLLLITQIIATQQLRYKKVGAMQLTRVFNNIVIVEILFRELNTL
jgi:hypothetical protein